MKGPYKANQKLKIIFLELFLFIPASRKTNVPLYLDDTGFRKVPRCLLNVELKLLLFIITTFATFYRFKFNLNFILLHK